MQARLMTMMMLMIFRLMVLFVQEGGESEECLQSVQTSRGPKTVVSVSKTYIKLKDLILEKKALKKETNRLKTLNVHLERRLETQEKRLSAVSLELTKTWHLVGKMQVRCLVLGRPVPAVGACHRDVVRWFSFRMGGLSVDPNCLTKSINHSSLKSGASALAGQVAIR